MFKTSLIDSAYKSDFQCGLMWISPFAPLTSFAPVPPPSRSAFRPSLLSFEFSRDFLGFVLPALSSQCPMLYVRLGQICCGNSSNIMAQSFPLGSCKMSWDGGELSQGHCFSVRGLGIDSDSLHSFLGTAKGVERIEKWHFLAFWFFRLWPRIHKGGSAHISLARDSYKVPLEVTGAWPPPPSCITRASVLSAHLSPSLALSPCCRFEGAARLLLRDQHQENSLAPAATPGLCAAVRGIYCHAQLQS